MNWTSYLIQINLYLALFYAFYWLFLRKETFFNLNRTYLLGSALFSVTIPLIKAQWINHLLFTEKVQQSWTNVTVAMMQGYATPVKESWVLGDYLTLIYYSMIFILFIRLIYKLVKIKRLLREENAREAFSFFRKIRINRELPQQMAIEKHELAHAKQLHSADVLLFEALAILNWFNPVIYLYKMAIRHIHEFIADQEVLRHETDKQEYALLLVSNRFGVNPNTLTNNFFNPSILKRRIEMMNKTKSTKTAILKYGFSAPLFLLAMVLSSAKISENKTLDKIADQVQPQMQIREILVPEVVRNLVQTKQKETKDVKKFDDDFSALKKYIGKTIRYPQEARESGMMSKIAIQFKVNESGKITNVKALNTMSDLFNEEGVKIISSFNDEIEAEPGLYTIFLSFQIQDSKGQKLDATQGLGPIKNFIGEVLIVAYPPSNTSLNEVAVQGEVSKEDNNDQVFTNVDYLPSFPGGLEAFGKFLSGNIKYPKTAKVNNIQGRVYCNFVVEKDGSLRDIKVVRGIGGGCDEEAVRVLAISPKWNPGLRNGEKVRVSYTIPVFFQLDKKEAKGIGKIQNEDDEKAYVNIKNTDGSGFELNLSDSLKFNSNLMRLKTPNKSKNPLPKLYLDGKEVSQSELELIKPSDIASVNVLKSETAIKTYGLKGKNGVVLITTKKKE